MNSRTFYIPKAIIYLKPSICSLNWPARQPRKYWVIRIPVQQRFTANVPTMKLDNIFACFMGGGRIITRAVCVTDIMSKQAVFLMLSARPAHLLGNRETHAE